MACVGDYGLGYLVVYLHYKYNREHTHIDTRSFATIARAVEEGRRIGANIVKVRTCLHATAPTLSLPSYLIPLHPLSTKITSVRLPPNDGQRCRDLGAHDRARLRRR